MHPRRRPLDALQHCLCPAISKVFPVKVDLSTPFRGKVVSRSFTRKTVGEGIRPRIQVYIPRPKYETHQNGPARVAPTLFSNTAAASKTARITHDTALRFVARLGSARKYPDVFEQAERLVLSGDLEVTTELYEILISACASGPLDSMEDLAFQLLAEMKESGIRPTAATYLHLLRLLSKSPNYVRRSRALAEMQENWYQVSDLADQWVIMGYIYDGQLELALDKIQRRSKLGLDVDLDVYKILVRCLIEFGEVEVALGVFNATAQKTPPGQQELPWVQSDRVDAHQWRKLWYDFLRVSAEERNLDCTKEAWLLVIGSAGAVPLFTPDEGLRMLVLYTAAQHGDVQLATSVLETMELEGIAREEHHYAALVEAYARSGNFRELFSIISKMRQNGPAPSPSTISCAVMSMASSAHSASSALSDLQHQHDAGSEPVDLESFHLVLAAFIRAGDLEGALNLYKDRPELFPNFNMRPNTHTFNLLLSGCAVAGQTEVSLFLVAEMKAIGVLPDQRTYEALIKTCLNAPFVHGEQKPHGLALLYMEKASTRGLALSPGIYTELALKCAEEDDMESSLAVFQEMDHHGWDSAEGRQKLHRKWRETTPSL